VREAERDAAIRSIENFFAPLSEQEADRILRAAGSEDVTPAGWGNEPEAIKRVQIRRFLANRSDDLLTELVEFLPAAERVSITTEVAPGRLPAVEVKREYDGPVFVVHGHARAALHEAVRVLERGTGREVIVLHEQANAGRTILEKFEDYATDASFAVVLLTGDDEGGVRTGTNRHLRGRQNVIFELGFFFGKLGRRRVAVLLEENVEKPSDIDGLVYITIDQAGAWKQALARELEAADIPVNRSRIP
jgi:predicted nucleotide-binding protein